MKTGKLTGQTLSSATAPEPIALLWKSSLPVPTDASHASEVQGPQIYCTPGSLRVPPGRSRPG
jgi:hypothetical protein